MKKLPTDHEAEMICLGAALARQDSLDMIVDQLDQSHLYDSKHRHIWGALHEFWRTGQRPDVVDVGEQLDHQGNLERAGGMAYLLNMENAARGVNLPLYIDRVRTSYKRRKLIELAQSLLGRADKDDLDDVLNDVGVELSNISSLTGDEAVFLEDLFLGKDGLIEDYKKAAANRKLGHTVMAGVPTGMNEVDELLGGLAPSRFVVVAARTGIGKTEFITQLLAQHCRHGVKALVFSMEMDGREYASRTGGPLVRIHGNRSMAGDVTDEELGRYDELAKNLRGPWKGNILIYPKAAVNTRQIKAITRRYIESHGIKVVYVDHMGLVKGHGKSIYEKTTEISRDLKEIAMELGICVVSACQINREAVDGELPKLHHLRDSGAIEQDANQVILLSRLQDGNDPRSIWAIDVAKNRHGPICKPKEPIKYYYDYRAAYVSAYVPIQDDIGDEWEGLGR